jgi:hypothetical protein
MTEPAAPAAPPATVRAVYRPRQRDILILRDDGESLAIPEADALALAEALRQAFAVPALPAPMALEAGSAR